MAEADWKARVISFPNAIKHNPPESPYAILNWKSFIDEIPECELKEKHLKCIEDYFKSQEFVDNVGKNRPPRNRRPYLEALAWIRGKARRKPNFRKVTGSSRGSISGSSSTSYKTHPHQEQEQEQDPDQENIKRSHVDKPPKSKPHGSKAAGIIAKLREENERMFVDFGEHEDLARELMDKLKLTRNSGDISANVQNKILRDWLAIRAKEEKRFIWGAKIYLHYEYYLQDKSEKYLKGIMRSKSLSLPKELQETEGRDWEKEPFA